MAKEIDLQRLPKLHRKLKDDNRNDGATLSSDERTEFRALFSQRRKLQLDNETIRLIKSDIEAAALREVYLEDLIEAFKLDPNKLTPGQKRELWALLHRFAPKGQEIATEVEKHMFGKNI